METTTLPHRLVGLSELHKLGITSASKRLLLERLTAVGGPRCTTEFGQHEWWLDEVYLWVEATMSEPTGIAGTAGNCARVSLTQLARQHDLKARV